MSEILDSARAGPSFASAGLRAEARRGLLFLAVGSLGLAADATVLSLLQALGAGRPAARAASLVVATLLTFALNRGLTFAGRVRHRRSALARYAAVTLVAQGSSYALFLALSAALPGLSALAALLVSAAAATALSFTGQRLFTFPGA